MQEDHGEIKDIHRNPNFRMGGATNRSSGEADRKKFI